MDWFIAHLVGDYLLQNDWMQIKKGTLLPTEEDNYAMKVGKKVTIIWPDGSTEERGSL